MIPALLTAVLFAASGICGRRSVRAFGPLPGNTLRLLLSTILLGLLCLALGALPFQSRTAARLILSGAVGFGVGDVALFAAYHFLGVRLTLLMNLSSAPVFGALVEWLLTGSVPGGSQVLPALLILAGVMIALVLGKPQEAEGLHQSRARGVAAALMAGFGQGCGAALSRFAGRAAVEEGIHLLPIQEAFIRVIPGLVFSAGLWFFVSRSRRDGSGAVRPSFSWVSAGWLFGAACFGPIVGVSCFQWSLAHASSAVVLSITATTPILVIPMAAWIDKDYPDQAAVVGAFIAVIGVVWLGLVSPT